MKVGTRIELPVHYDWWMRGARYGVVTSIRPGRNGFSTCAYVKLDALPVKARRVKLWKLDWSYANIL